MTVHEAPLEEFEAFSRARRKLSREDQQWTMQLSQELSGNAVKRMALERFNGDNNKATAIRTVFRKLQKYPALGRFVEGA